MTTTTAGDDLTLITTMNTPSSVYRLIFGNAIKKALFTGTFWKMGYGPRKWINLNMVRVPKNLPFSRKPLMSGPSGGRTVFVLSPTK